MILGFVESDGGRPSPLSLEMLTLGRRLAEELQIELHAVLIGEGSRPMAEELGSYGVAAAHMVVHDRLEEYAPAAWAQGVVDIVDAVGPEAVLAAGSDRGNEVFAHIAARTGLPMAANCTEVHPGEPYLVRRLRWGGSLLEEARLEGIPKLLTVAPHAVAALAATSSGAPQVIDVKPGLSDDDFLVRVVERVAADPGKVSLPEARVVVGGGRGVGSADGFGELEELADLLGGTVGVSRVVTSLGWRPHSDQVGQTGTRIAPDIYIACGISGAIQHMVGCKAAKSILAINSDPEAPIIAKADYAIVGDLHAFLPALIAEIKKAKEATG